MMREATRMTYLLDFALAILAAFGVEALISAGKGKASWPALDRVKSGTHTPSRSGASAVVSGCDERCNLGDSE